MTRRLVPTLAIVACGAAAAATPAHADCPRCTPPRQCLGPPGGVQNCLPPFRVAPDGLVTLQGPASARELSLISEAVRLNLKPAER